MSWAYGDVIVWREIDWGVPGLATPAFVVEDSPALLATYVPTAAPFAFSDVVAWSTPTGRHPWWPNPTWQGHGCLMLQRPGEAYSVWHMWAGDDRRFVSWYLNLQEPFRRTAIGYDTEDHELDVIVLEDGQWFFKDEEKVEIRVEEGRYSAAKAEVIRALGTQIGEMLDRGEAWWDPELRHWQPDESWATPPAVAPGWETVPWEDWREPEVRSP